MTIYVGEVIQITDVQTYLGQILNNVYYYVVQATEVAATLEDVVNDFQTFVVDELVNAQSTSLVHTRLIGKDLSGGVDIFEKPINVLGIWAGGDNDASFAALGIRLVRATAITRHGSKRIGGLKDAASIGNSLAASYETIVEDICTALAAPLISVGTVDHDYTADPVIVGRVHEPDPDAGDLDLGILNPVTSAQFISITTQTTRKAGRGT